MALLKRRKRKVSKTEKPAPGWQLLCGECGAPILADDSLGVIPPCQCPECGHHHPPTLEEDLVRVGRIKALEDRARIKREEVERRKAKALPAVWVPKIKTTKTQKAELRRVEREEEIFEKSPEQLTSKEWKWLRAVMSKIIPENPQGRKREPQYSDWECQIARAKLLGKKPPRLRDLAGLKLSEVELNSVRDRFKKARKRAQIPVPPKT